MSLTMGQKLETRAMIYVAGKPVPLFWPMRSFIHHNPLHSLEHLPFFEAVKQGEHLFHGRGFLPRTVYQRYLAEGKVDRAELSAIVASFAAERRSVPGLDLARWLMVLLTEFEHPVNLSCTLASATAIKARFQNAALPPSIDDPRALSDELRISLLDDRPVYETVDLLYGTEIGSALDELVIKSCLNFFDEGQSVWDMPEREQGFFTAWRDLTRRHLKLAARSRHLDRILGVDDSAEGVIVYVMEALEVPKDRWVAYFTNELARLHGWAGFIRWRSSVKHYHWRARFPGDLVDFVAVRLTLGLALLREQGDRIAESSGAIAQVIDTRPQEVYLRREFYSGDVLPGMAHRVEGALLRGDRAVISNVFADYVACKRDKEANAQAKSLRALSERTGDSDTVAGLSEDEFARLLQMLGEFERKEGMFWLRAMEARAMKRLLQGVDLSPPVAREKRPFVQSLFCIDTRSERIRRHLEGVGDYQTFGVAGFFGVPVSFMELGKGSESHLCPVLLTPKNLVLEMSAAGPRDDAALTALGKALHELKESVLTPFVTVEAIGLLFGLDMVGKTVAPLSYNRWRDRLHATERSSTHLLLDKLSREQADSIVRAVQRAVIVKAVEQEFALEPEQITDDLIRALRESALGNYDGEIPGLGVDREEALSFVRQLRTEYRINPSFAQLQLEQLGRIGFSLDEQARYVSQALSSIGLTEGFSRFVLLVGHGSTSENNPYESALDCGACGGNHGLVSARVLAQMANKPEVRRRLRKQGIDIADDAWFVPAFHNTTTDSVTIADLELLPPSHLVYLDRLRNGLTAASRLCAQERLPGLQEHAEEYDAATAFRGTRRNATDWSQVRPEWGLSRNAYFIIGRRGLTEGLALNGRAFLHSYDYRVDRKRRLLENILTGPLVVGQWINMEHYFSTVDNERFGSGSKAFHNVAGRFGVMTGNLSDLRTGLPSQTVLERGEPYHEPLRLITVIEAPFEHARRAVEGVVAVKQLVRNQWIRLLIVDPETATVSVYEDGQWRGQPHRSIANHSSPEESGAL